METISPTSDLTSWVTMVVRTGTNAVCIGQQIGQPSEFYKQRGELRQAAGVLENTSGNDSTQTMTAVTDR
jgi:hypothetical protein